MSKKLFFIFLFAFLIRLISLNQSLWLDEATTARVVREYELTRIVNEFSPNDFHPPLYYLFMKGWTNIFGYSEAALRFPSIIFSLGVGWFVYLTGGIWPAIFFLFNPLIIYYSQEARMYMMATFFLTGVLYYFIKISNLKTQNSCSQSWKLCDGRRANLQLKWSILFGLFLILSLLTFYGSVFLIAAFLVYFLYKKQYKYFILNTLYLILFFLLISPLFYQQFINSKIVLANVSHWSLVLGKANLKNLLLIPIKFSIGRIDFYPKWIYYAVTGVWTIFVFFSLFKNLKLKNKKLLKTPAYSAGREKLELKILFAYLFIFPLLLGFFVSFFTPLLQYFRFIYLIPIMAILLAKNKGSLNQYILAAGFLVFSFAYLLFPQFHREDWRSLAKDIPARSVVYMIKSSSDPIKYYRPDLEIKELEKLADLKNFKKIIVIPYTAQIYGLDYQQKLIDQNFSLKKKISYREVVAEIWVKD